MRCRQWRDVDHMQAGGISLIWHLLWHKHHGLKDSSCAALCSFYVHALLLYQKPIVIPHGIKHLNEVLQSVSGTRVIYFLAGKFLEEIVIPNEDLFHFMTLFPAKIEMETKLKALDQ